MDMLFFRYGAGARDILTMDFNVGIEIMYEGLKQRQEDMIYLRWIHGYQSIGFDEFKLNLIPKEEKPDNRNKEEIFDIVKGILE